MCFPTYRQQGLLIALGLADRRHDVRDLLQRAGSSERPPAARALFVEGGRVLHRLRQSRHAISAGGRLGDGLGDHGRHEDRLGLDRRRRDGGNATSIRRWCSPPSTGRRSFSTSSTTSGRSRPIRASPAARAPKFAARAHGFGIPSLRVDGNDYLAVYAVSKWAVEAGAAQSRPDADRMGDLPRRRPFDLGRPVEIPAEGGMGRLAAGRSGRAAEDPSHPPRRVERGPPQADAGGGRRGGARGRERGGKPRHAARRAEAERRDDVRGVFKEMPRHLREQRQQLGV